MRMHKVYPRPLHLSIIIMHYIMYFYVFFTFGQEILLHLCILCGKLNARNKQRGIFMTEIRNAVLTVDLAILRENIARIAGSLGGAGILPVLKADAYGLGMVRMARALEGECSVAGFAVAQVSEGLTLREAGIAKDILVLGKALPLQAEAAIAAGLTLTVGSVSDVSTFDAIAKRLGTQARVQISFDTGLHRIGIDETNFYACADELCRAGSLDVRGAYSHFADTDDDARCREQFTLFQALCDRLEAAGIPLPMRHISDSAASERFPEFNLDAVRLGRRLCWDAPTGRQYGTRELATLTAQVLDVRTRKRGERVGYGEGILLDRDAEIAVLGIGYGDGLSERMAEKRLPVLLGGKPCPMLYTFMDQALLDVTGANAHPGDTATIFGYAPDGTLLSAQAQALACGENEGCALTTALLPRVCRVYRE